MDIFFRISRDFAADIKSKMKSISHSREKMMPYASREMTISESNSSARENPTAMPFGQGHSGQLSADRSHSFGGS